MKRKLENKINEVLNKFIGSYIEAHDSNRWVASDGFYEVEFSLKIPILKDRIFIHSLKGDISLENEWSENNPQPVVFSDFSYMLSDFDCEFAITEIDDYTEDYKNY